MIISSGDVVELKSGYASAGQRAPSSPAPTNPLLDLSKQYFSAAKEQANQTQLGETGTSKKCSGVENPLYPASSSLLGEISTEYRHGNYVGASLHAAAAAVPLLLVSAGTAGQLAGLLSVPYATVGLLEVGNVGPALVGLAAFGLGKLASETGEWLCHQIRRATGNSQSLSEEEAGSSSAGKGSLFQKIKKFLDC